MIIKSIIKVYSEIKEFNDIKNEQKLYLTNDFK